MPTLPQLIEEDVRQFDAILAELLRDSEAAAALLIDKGGFLICEAGAATQFDNTTLAALASGAFLASQTIAGIIGEETFSSAYQQGEKRSLLITNVDEHSLLVTVFAIQTPVGAVKYFASSAAEKISRQMLVAHARNPAEGLDLSVLNLANPSELFQRKNSRG